MAAPIWPPALPQKAWRDNFSEDIMDPRLVYDMDKGHKTRTTGHLFPDEVTVTYVLDNAEYDILTEFVKNTLGYGVKAFDYPHPLQQGAYIRAEFKKTGESLLKRNYYGNTLHWQVQFTLRLYPYAPIA